MQERHHDYKQYFEEQALTTRKYVIPFLRETNQVNETTTVLEIGCGQGGNLIPFIEIGCPCVGVDISDYKINVGKEYFSKELQSGILKLICEDIYKWNSSEQFDIIIMRDVIEHIPDQEKFMGYVKKYLKPTGKFYLGFPPWQNPFGGHQQVCKSKFLSRMPWIHLLPNFLYKGLLRLFGENPNTIISLMEVKETGISLDRFERICRKENYKKEKVIYYFIQPNYEVKFKMKPRKAWRFISAIPWVRNFFITCGYFILSKRESIPTRS